jgi:hypothetical protein
VILDVPNFSRLRRKACAHHRVRCVPVSNAKSDSASVVSGVRRDDGRELGGRIGDLWAGRRAGLRAGLMFTVYTMILTHDKDVIMREMDEILVQPPSDEYEPAHTHLMSPTIISTRSFWI